MTHNINTISKRIIALERGEERLKEREKNMSNKTLERINKLLQRKDIIDIDNDRVDALRMLCVYLENPKSKAKDLVKYLKNG